jgi:hypothetical protein
MEDNEAVEAIKAQVRHRREQLGMTVAMLADRADLTLSDLESLDFANEDEYSDTLVNLDEALQWRLGSISKMWKFRSVGKIGWDVVPEPADPEPWGGQEPWGVPDKQRPAAHFSDAELTAELTYRLLSRS